MEQRPRGRPPKVVESVKPVNKTRDADITIILSMPGHSEYEETFKIKDIVGYTNGTERRPEIYMEYIKSKIK